MWNRFNPRPERASEEMCGYACQLIDKLKPYLPIESASAWLTVPEEMTRGRVKELGIEIRKSYDGDIYASCCFDNRTEHFGGSLVVTHETMEEVAAWLKDEKNFEDVAFLLQDLYENTHTWD